MDDTLTIRFMTIINYLIAKYELTPEEIAELHNLGYDLCLTEYDKDSADFYFRTPVDEDGNILKEGEKN